jgi:hypothetical protein
MKRLIIFALLLLFAVPALAQLTELGINPLQIEIGSRPLAMGGAFAGLADDANATFYNPAGLAWVKGVSLSIRDPENIVGVQAYPTGFNSSFGFGIATRKLSGIPIPTGVADAKGSVVFLSYGTKLSLIPFLYEMPFFKRFGIGVNLKGLAGQTLRRTGFIDRSATGWDVDVGALWKGADWWSAGMSAHNILPADALGGGLIRWDVGGEEKIPTMARVAGSARVIGDIESPIFMEGKELLLGVEVDSSENHPMMYRFGGEFGFDKTYYLRAGFMQQPKNKEVSSDFNFGAGLRFGEWGIDFANYKEPLRDERCYLVSFLYLPKEWIVLRKLDVERPVLMIENLSLKDNVVTYKNNIEVSGRVKPEVEVYVNGSRAYLGPGSVFKTTVPLHMGKNLIVVEARYNGEKKVWKYKVLRKAEVKIAEEKKVKEELKKAKTKEQKEKAERKKKEIEEKKEKVETLVTVGVIEITPEEDFTLEAGVTRGELSTWIVKMADMKLPVVKKDLFSDVPKNHPLAPYIKIVTDLKLLKPFPDGTFRPGAVVTKDEGDAIFKYFGVTL